MNLLTKMAAVLVACCATLSHAATSSTDFSDLWSNANEQGWGANVIQQNDILFVTLFVNNQSNAPVWYVASAVTRTANTGTTLNFTGTVPTIAPISRHVQPASINPRGRPALQRSQISWRDRYSWTAQ